MSYAKAAYSVTASNLHWFTAIPVVGCIGCVLKAQNSPKNEVGTWMHRHKSLGLLSAMIIAPRLAYRVFNMSAVRTIRRRRCSRQQENYLGGTWVRFTPWPFSGLRWVPLLLMFLLSCRRCRVFFSHN
jgi:hypothetical protein